MAVFSFSKPAKLVKTDDFSSVFSFRKRIIAHYLIVHYQPNTLHQARLGLVVGKRVAKSSVHRNYMRRVLREQFRLRQHEMPSVDLVVMVQKFFNKKVFAQVQQEFDTMLVKLKQRIQ